MIVWLCFISIALGIIGLIFLIDIKEVGIGIAALVIAAIGIVLSIVIPTEEEQYVTLFEAGYYQMDTDKAIEEYDGSIKDVAVALKKENMDVVKIEPINNDGFKFIIVSPNEDRTFFHYDVFTVKEIIEAGWLIPVTEETTEQTETTTEEIEKIDEGYYYVADKVSIARNYDNEATLIMLKLAEMKQTHVRITVSKGQAVASILDDETIYLLKCEDVLKMIKEKNLIFDNEFKYVSVNEAA